MANKQELDFMEDFFAENGVDALSAMSEMLSTQQNIALNLTKIVFEHRAKSNISTQEAKKEVFAVYEEASDVVKDQLEM
jgi:RNAse (barnase) inhibitor barstar